VIKGILFRFVAILISFAIVTLFFKGFLQIFMPAPLRFSIGEARATTDYYTHR
jgi:hypothetical protein